MCPKCCYVMPIDPVTPVGSVDLSHANAFGGETPTATAGSPSAIPIPSDRNVRSVIQMAVLVAFTLFVTADLTTGLRSGEVDWNTMLLLVAIPGVVAFVLTKALWQLCGWEYVSVSGQILRVERRILGLKVRAKEARPSAVRYERPPKPERYGPRRMESAALWFFTNGCVIVEYGRSEFRFAEGLNEHPEIARELVDRLRKDLFGTQSA